MTCLKFKFGDSVGIVSVGGPVRKIFDGYRVWHFEMHHYCGPMPVHKKTGDGITGTPKFWEAVSKWAQQGYLVDEAGVCHYDSKIKLSDIEP